MTLLGEGHVTPWYQVGERKSRAEGTSRDPSGSRCWGLDTWTSFPHRLHPVVAGGGGGAEASSQSAPGKCRGFRFSWDEVSWLRQKAKMVMP